MNLAELRNKDSELVQAALQRKCVVCPSSSGEVCVDLAAPQTLFDAVGRWVHLMRADGLPYTLSRKKES